MKVLETLEKYLLYTTVAIFPVFFLLNSTAPVIFPKAELLFFSLSILILIWVIKIVVKGSVSFSFGKFDLGVLLIAVTYLASAIIKTPNKMEAFLIPGTTTFVLFGAIFYFLANQLDKKGKQALENSFFFSGLFLSLSLILAQVGFFTKIPQLPLTIKDSGFNPIGGNVPAILYLIPSLLIGVALILKDNDIVKKIFSLVAEAVILMALVILIGQSLPNKPQSIKLPTFSTTWEVAIQTLAKSPIFGIGPANYLTAFNQYRSVSYNQTDLWATRFTTATNYYLTVLTETGLLGLFSFSILLIAVYKTVKKDLTNIEKLTLAATLISLALLPASPAIVFTLFIILSFVSLSENNVKNTNFSPKFLAYGFAVMVVAGIGWAYFYGTKMALAEAYFTNSLSALARNDGKATFELMQKAINQNPQVDRYHASFAQIEMALAQSLANKKDITDTEKQTITQLVQGAINEGKATVILNPERSANWELLAQIYRSVMPFATGADQFAIQTYTQASALDPTNPNLRIALGGVYYALGRYDDAIEAFKVAVLAKPDLANAHYNLAIAYREKKNYDQAIEEMNNVLNLVQKDSADYKLAQSTLEDLKKNQTSKPSVSENLTSPEQIGSSNIKPPIELPKEATPPGGQ